MTARVNSKKPAHPQRGGWGWRLSRVLGWIGVGLTVGMALPGCSERGADRGGGAAEPIRTFQVTGSIQSIAPDRQSVVIRHEAIPDYMEAMIMPFPVRDSNVLAGVVAGDVVAFRLSVTEEDSWIDRISVTAHVAPGAVEPASTADPEPLVGPGRHPLKEFPFTNELNQVTRIRDFEGSAVGITFIFTRCPIPNYCPRLTQNFASAIRKLQAMPEAPTNWHFLSVTIDPAFDTPAVLKEYGERYNYDPARWSFLTGPVRELEALAQQSGVTAGSGGNLGNHNFRTLIIDATGRLQMSFPTSGDLSEMIVSEIVKGAKVMPLVPGSGGNP